MSRYIDADEAIKWQWYGNSNSILYRQYAVEVLKNAPTVDMVSKELLDQIKWERDIALGQLEKLGISLGQEIDGVYLTKEEHDELLEYMWIYKDLTI